MDREENRLVSEASPYLRQHRFDPVDWYPWGEEAMEAARELDRPLFLSIGYSACHWCHVMAHESFSDAETAAEMNEAVVAVKIDREEHPDVDAVYMESVIAANGNGGWPMSVFATPDGRPFFTGTYFPNHPRQGMPSFRQVLAAVSDVWANRREDVEEQATALSEAVSKRLRPPPPLLRPGADDHEAVLDSSTIRSAHLEACARLGELHDPVYGGFGEAPKFPQPLLIDLLLRAHVFGIEPAEGPDPLEIATRALLAMASGGIYDQLEGGFSRYSVDRYFLVPHFEKMLYDEALLARCYLHAWQLTRDERFAQVLEETLSYVLERLSSPDGGLFSAEDADSEGEEGRFYLWTKAELREVVGEELAEEVSSFYGVSEEGNFEGRNILHRPEVGELSRPPAIEKARELLRERRAERTRPGLDDKVLVEWNAMVLTVLAEAAGARGEGRYAETAARVEACLFGARNQNGGVTPRSVRSDGGPMIEGFAADVAWLCRAETALFELTGEPPYLERALLLAEELVDGFVERSSGTVFTTREGRPGLLVRPAELTDGVIPSAGSVAALALYRLGDLAGRDDLTDIARSIVVARSREIGRAPSAVPELLWAAHLCAEGMVEIAAVGAGRQLLETARRRFIPQALYVPASEEELRSEMVLPLLEGREEDAVYVCKDRACRLPARSGEELERELEAVLGAR